ncbi:hypothetical protein ABK040_015047 [Willaertia magna]
MSDTHSINSTSATTTTTNNNTNQTTKEEEKKQCPYSRVLSETVKVSSICWIYFGKPFIAGASMAFGNFIVRKIVFSMWYEGKSLKETFSNGFQVILNMIRPQSVTTTTTA